MTQYYGVWIGRKPGVYDNWNDCKAQVDKFSGARYSKLKSTTKEEALLEFNKENNNTIDNSKETIKSTNNVVNTSNKPIENVLTVDGASNGLNCEFQAVWYPSGEVAFKSKQYQGGTNNIAEFLGLVLAIKHLEKNNLPLSVYTDSVTAMAWLRDKKANTTAKTTGKATEELDKLINQAETYLKEKERKINIMKWETKSWGQIPADYGRK